MRTGVPAILLVAGFFMPMVRGCGGDLSAYAIAGEHPDFWIYPVAGLVALVAAIGAMSGRLGRLVWAGVAGVAAFGHLAWRVIELYRDGQQDAVEPLVGFWVLGGSSAFLAVASWGGSRPTTASARLETSVPAPAPPLPPVWKVLVTVSVVNIALNAALGAWFDHVYTSPGLSRDDAANRFAAAQSLDFLFFAVAGRLFDGVRALGMTFALVGATLGLLWLAPEGAPGWVRSVAPALMVGLAAGLARRTPLRGLLAGVAMAAVLVAWMQIPPDAWQALPPALAVPVRSVLFALGTWGVALGVERVGREGS